MGISFGRSNTKSRAGIKDPSQSSHCLLPMKRQDVRFWLNTTSEDIYPLYNGRQYRQRQDYQMHYDGLDTRFSNSKGIYRTLSALPSLGDADYFLFGYCS